MGREHRVLSALAEVDPKVPRTVLLVEDEAVLGAPFYLTERARGVILRRDPPKGVSLAEATARGLSKTFVDTLVELHTVDVSRDPLASLSHPEGYVERQVQGWTARYAKAKIDDIPDVERAAGWLAEHIPTSGAPALVHNDFKYDNLVLDPDDLRRVRAVLDWEMATVGDPLTDLGTALAYWVQADDEEELQAFRTGPTHLPGMKTRAELAERYAERMRKMRMSGVRPVVSTVPSNTPT